MDAVIQGFVRVVKANEVNGHRVKSSGNFQSA